MIVCGLSAVKVGAMGPPNRATSMRSLTEVFCRRGLRYPKVCGPLCFAGIELSNLERGARNVRLLLPWRCGEDRTARAFRAPRRSSLSLAGSAPIDDQPLDDLRHEDDGTQLSQLLGEVPPGVERRISIGYLVNPTIDNIDLQAALLSPRRASSAQTWSPWSRSPRRSCRIPRRTIMGTRRRRARHRARTQFKDMVAPVIVVVLPLPGHTKFVTGSAHLDGRDFIPDDDGDDPLRVRPRAGWWDPRAPSRRDAGAAIVARQSNRRSKTIRGS